MLHLTPPDQDLGMATPDGVYDTRKCHDAIAARNWTNRIKALGTNCV